MSRISSSGKTWLWMFAIIVMAAPCLMAQNTLTLNVSQAKDTIKKTIYGGLMEDWGRDIYGGIYVGTTSSIPNTNGMRNDIIAGLKEIGVGVLQFPGGCKSEVYHWKDGVGTKSSRPGGEKVNGMGTDEYFQLCDLVDCAPFIQANCKEATPAEMKAWLDYINTNFPNKLRYLGMGNEPWGGCYPGISVTEYLNNWYDPFKAVIPATFSGKIIRIAAAGYTDEKTCDLAWTNSVLQREVGSMEGLSWHYYTTMSWTEGQKGSSTSFNETGYYNILTRAYAMETQAKKVIDAMNTRDPDITIGLQPDEWGAWYDQISGMGTSYQQSTVRDAQITAQHLNFFNNNCRRIWMAQLAQPVNAIHAWFLTNPSSGALIKTPTFYVFKMYVPHHNARMVPATLSCSKVNNLNVLTASASVDKSDVLHISVNNIHATATQTLTITLNGGSYNAVSGQIVNGPAITSYNDYNKAEAVNLQDFASSNYSLSGNTVTVTLPAHSVVMLTLKPSGTAASNGLMNAGIRGLSIAAAPGGCIVVGCGGACRTPPSVSVVDVDGRKIDGTTVSGGGTAQNVVWRPAAGAKAHGVYIANVKTDGMTTSQKVMLIR
ncbi:MAG: hypothetical protein JXA18_06075 [Chitinispirillaceae bacterium]|nr:hypothetical protein [Chitinispirillaceae bacterium]